MSNKTLLYVGLALGLVVVSSVIVRSRGEDASERAPASAPESSSEASSSGQDGAAAPLTVPLLSAPAASAPLPVQRPARAVVELGVLTDRPEAALAPLLDRAALAAKLTPELCGDGAACDAVRATLRDEGATTVQVVDASSWSLEKADVDGGARGLSAAERAAVPTRARVVVVHVATPATPQALALRTALAATALLARQLDAVVWDQLLARFEPARAFAAHAVTTPLDASAFRRDRVEVLYEPKGEGLVRVLTSGLSRWGQPDVEAAALPAPVAPRMGELALAVAEALVGGARTQPLVLTLTDLARARGQAYAGDAGYPSPAPVEVELVTTHPENGDPNDFMARIVPAGGEGPIGYVDLAERFFGPVLAASPGESVMSDRRARAQAALAGALAKWKAASASGAKLTVLLPFPIPGDAGVESMWIEVTGADAAHVTGTIVDEPLGATDVKRGDSVTRPRTQVEDFELRGGTP